MSYPPPPGYGQQPQQPGYPPQQGGYAPQPQQPYGQPSQPGYGAPQQPGPYGAPQQPPGPYGAPPPMPPTSGGGGGGLVAKILGGVAVLVIGFVVIIVRYFAGDSGSDSDSTDTTLSNDEVQAAEAAAVGDCMSDAAATVDADLVVPCDDPAAYWTITQVSDDSGAQVDFEGNLTDPSIGGSICGQEYMGWTPGEPWLSYQYVYTEEISGTGGPVDYLYCVEAIDKEDAEGGRPVTPNTGDCTDGTLRTFDCSNAAALYVVDELEVYDTPIEEASYDETTVLGGCPNSDYYATPVTGGDGLVYLAYCSSNNA